MGINYRESVVQLHLESECRKRKWFVRRIKYVGRKGCADDIVVAPLNRVFLVETKRPKGGRIKVHQEEDAKQLLEVGTNKLFLFTIEEVDAFIKRVEG